MADDSESIRHEIKRVLLKNGLTKSKKIADEIIMTGKIAEKDIYEELKKMTIEGILIEQSITGTGNKKAYELADLAHTITKQIENLQTRLGFLDTELSMFYERNSTTSPSDPKTYMTRMQDILLFIHEIESIQSLIRILELFPTFKNNSKFPKLKNHLEKTWKSILANITLQSESEFLQEVVSNIASTEKLVDHHNLPN